MPITEKPHTLNIINSNYYRIDMIIVRIVKFYKRVNIVLLFGLSFILVAVCVRFV